MKAWSEELKKTLHSKGINFDKVSTNLDDESGYAHGYINFVVTVSLFLNEEIK